MNTGDTQLSSGERIVVLFPGIGYTCDKPLLYYSGKLAYSLGWEVLPVPYNGFPPKVRGDHEKLAQSMEIALAQTEDMLKDINWSQYQQILFVSKSIGTVVAVTYANTHQIPCRHILFTPVAETFAQQIPDAISFHGTADPWAETSRIMSLCEASNVPLFTTEGANHSLETGDALRDIANLECVMQRVRSYMLGK